MSSLSRVYRWVMKICFVFPVVISVNLSLAMAADYFVATTGNDGNRGTIQQPFRNIERGAQALASGDRLFIRAGTYERNQWPLAVPSGGGSWATATTVSSYNNEKVIITPYDTTTDTGSDILRFNNGLSWIIINGLILDGLNQNGGKGGGFGIKVAYNGHHFRFSNLEIRYTAKSAIHTGNATHNEFLNLHIHHANHNLPSNHPNFRRMAYGIYLDSANNLLMGCDIHDNRGYGIHMYSGNTYKPHNNTFIGNVVHDNERSGFLINSGSGSVLINNIAYGNGTGASDGYKGDNRFGMIVDWGAHNTIMYHNTLYGNASGQMYIGGSANNTIARNNILAGLPGRVALTIYKGSKSPVIENNLIFGGSTDPGILVKNQEPSATLKGNLIGSRYDPKFKSVQNRNFHLTAESSARGIGLKLDEVKTDFDGVTRTLATGLIGAYGFDSGAYQYRQPDGSGG